MYKAILLLFLSAALAQAQTKPTNVKKLIEFGWDQPDTAFMRKHIGAMEKTPFDGCVFDLLYTDAKGVTGQFIWKAWGNRAFNEAEFKQAIDDLKNTPLKTFTHNFMRFNTTPGNVDWFEDFSAILNNAQLAAKIARQGKAAGILFDIEHYTAPLFDYRKQRDVKTKSFDEYAKQSRLRGRQVMAAFQEGYPDLTVILTFGYSLPYAQVNGTAEAGVDPAMLATVDYGLLKPFLDGMFDTVKDNAKIVDGFEISYPYKTAAQFEAIQKEMTVIADKLAADGNKFRRHSSLGFGLWMDCDWRIKAWDVNDFTKNHFTPAEFETSVRSALATADKYVWIYTEKPKWWTPPDGKPELLPKLYEDAVRKAAGKK